MKIMRGYQHPVPYLYNTSPYSLPAYGTVSYQPAPLDVNWHSAWPTFRSILLSAVMIISSTAIIGLDIANIAIEGHKQNGTSKLGSGTGKVGAGVWSGSVSFFAAISISAISKSKFLIFNPENKLHLLLIFFIIL